MRRYFFHFIILNWNISVIVSLARVQRALNCVRYIAVLRYASWESSWSPNRSSSTGNFLVQFSWRRSERRTVFNSFLLSQCWVCCVCAASDGWIIPFNSIDFCTPQYLRSSFWKNEGKEFGSALLNVICWIGFSRAPSVTVCWVLFI